MPWWFQRVPELDHRSHLAPDVPDERMGLEENGSWFFTKEKESTAFADDANNSNLAAYSSTGTSFPAPAAATRVSL